MADAKITQLSELTTIDFSDLLAIVDDPAGTPITKKITALNLSLGMFTFVRKTTETQVKNANTTLVEDDALKFAIGANEEYIFAFVINYTSNETADFKFAIQGPSGISGQWTSFFNHVGSVAATRTFVSQSETTWDGSVPYGVGAVSTVRTGLLVVGIGRNGATPGNISLNWAQNTSTAIDTKVNTDSFLVAKRIV